MKIAMVNTSLTIPIRLSCTQYAQKIENFVEQSIIAIGQPKVLHEDVIAYFKNNLTQALALSVKKAAANRVKRKTSQQWAVMWLLSVRLTIITILVIAGWIYAK